MLGDLSATEVPETVVEVVWENNHAGAWFFDEHGRQSQPLPRFGDRDSLDRWNRDTPD